MSSSNPVASGGPTSQTTSTPTVLSSPHPQVRCFSRPFSRFGILPVGGRSTAIKLQQPPNENAVWVLASTPLDEPVKESLKELGGEVKWIIAPDAVHSMFTEEWSKAFPEAKCIGVEGLEAKRPNIPWAGIYGKDREGTTYGFEEEIQARYFPTFANKDVAFHHIASRTAIVADLLFNLPAKEQYLGSPSKSPSSPVPFLTGMSQKFNPFSGLHSTFLWNAGAGAAIPEACVPEGVKLSTPGGSTEERRARFAKDAEIFAAWGAERVIPCHGDVIEGKGREAWLSACKKVSTRWEEEKGLRLVRPLADHLFHCDPL